MFSSILMQSKINLNEKVESERIDSIKLLELDIQSYLSKAKNLIVNFIEQDINKHL